MADEIKRINVTIGGMSYQLVAAENDVYIRQMAARADEMIRRVMQNNPQLSMNMSTVLALVNSMDELNRSYQQANQLDQQRMTAERQASDIRAELMRMREQNWELKKEVLRMNDLIHEYEELLDETTRTSEASPSEISIDSAAKLPSPDPHIAVQAAGPDTEQADSLTSITADDLAELEAQEASWTKP